MTSAMSRKKGEKILLTLSKRASTKGCSAKRCRDAACRVMCSISQEASRKDRTMWKASIGIPRHTLFCPCKGFESARRARAPALPGLRQISKILDKKILDCLIKNYRIKEFSLKATTLVTIILKF